MSVRIESFEDSDIREELKKMIKDERLIPIIGSGFTRGEKSKKGIVPSGKDMKDYMIKEILKANQEYEKEELENKEFSRITTYYFKEVNDEIIRNYYKDNFVYVHLSKEKQEFINIKWPYIYTLNIDDGIENNCKNYEVIYANKELYEDFSKYEGKFIYKLHGDAKNGYKYKSDEWFILSKEQYIKSLKNNETLLNLLSTDYFSRNIIFIGCSLEDEIDILNTVLNSTDEHSIERSQRFYVTKDNLSKTQLVDLESYGITSVIKVNDYDEFYLSMKKIYLESLELTKDEFDNFKNLKIKKFDKDLISNLKYMFLLSEKNNFKYEEKSVSVPYNYIVRSISKEILEEFDTQNFFVVLGRRISGKTHVLLNILDNIKDKDTYFFPSNINLNDNIVSHILEKKNTVFLFDSNTLGEDELDLIIKNNQIIVENGNKIVMSINNCDSYIIPYIKDNMIVKKELKNKFDSKEIEGMNLLLSELLLPDFDERKNLLDNILYYEEYAKTLPSSLDMQNDINIIERPKVLTDKELQIFILLALNQSMNYHLINTLNLSKEYPDILKKYSPIIDEDYTKNIESNQHSGFKLLNNANYWILKTIGDYAKIKVNKLQIAKVIKNIIRDCIYKGYKNQKITRLTMFDTLNDLFPREEGGAGELISIIYKELENILSTDPDYWIQRAKSILNIYSNYKDEDRIIEGIKCSQKAYEDVKKKIKNEKSNGREEKNLTNALFTTALLYGRLVSIEEYKIKSNVEISIQWYYNAFKDDSNVEYVYGLIEKNKRYLKENRKELADLYNLVRAIIANEITNDKDTLEKAEYLLKFCRDNGLALY